MDFDWFIYLCLDFLKQYRLSPFNHILFITQLFVYSLILTMTIIQNSRWCLIENRNCTWIHPGVLMLLIFYIFCVVFFCLFC